MSKLLYNQVLPLSGVYLAAQMIQEIARSGHISDTHLEMMLNTLLNTEPNSIEDVYGEVSHLAIGLQTMEDAMTRSPQANMQITRYVIALLGMERQLSRSQKSLGELSSRLETMKRRQLHVELLDDAMIEGFAQIYSDVLRPLAQPIHILGEGVHLKKPRNQYLIRTLLLCAVRSAVLWRQMGGKRRHLLFSRGKLAKEARQILTS
ncbi:high frequency lysogenization protein HflD [Algicola sagamiensis]|uniref:high frequency lysogenization protein HflD n=1 Tax=Algicola sagamiensis TaxID=163869 RepID=UPI00036985E2|nr:high frequency lysogenization protein HflD [Algicola sagamiensis]